MDEVAAGLWELADHHERKGEFAVAIKCLEGICQCNVSFLPIIEVKTRLRVATLLLRHTHNVNHAKSHLERSQLLLKSIPSCFELKCRAFSLLSQCYHLVGAIPQQKQILNRGLELIALAGEGIMGKLWFCNFNSQMANALIIEGDYVNSISSLERGYDSATEISYPELQMFFATSVLHVNLMHWRDTSVVESAVARCDKIWESIEEKKRGQCLGLLFYNQLLHVFHGLRICDYKSAAQHVEKLDAAMKADRQETHKIQELSRELNVLNQNLRRSDLRHRERSELLRKQAQIQEKLVSFTRASATNQEHMELAFDGNVRVPCVDKILLAPAPIDGEWLPKGAVYALVDLMVVIVGRPKGMFKECAKRIQFGIQSIEEELSKLGINGTVQEVELQHSAIWTASVYLMILMQFLENKVVIDLTRTEFVEAQEALVQMRSWYMRFPTILQACESIIEMLRGQYAHSTSHFREAAFHFVEASRLTMSKTVEAMCQVYAAISYLCVGDAESSSQALDLIGPIYRSMDSYTGVREKPCVLYAYGLLLMKQQNLQEARIRLANGLQITHNFLGNLQLVSQYLTILGSLALALRDTGQAREILRSSLTLAKRLYDVPTQIWVLSVMTALYQETGEKGFEMENSEYRMKKVEELQKKLGEARTSIHHLELINQSKIEIQRSHEVDMKRATAGTSTGTDLDIPESIGLSAPGPSSSKLVDLTPKRRSKRLL